ncbi:MAG: 23S rRNA (pseudouridine(1915)-N(3))-methyltransferase RlmH [Pseudomonadota bacterium]
MKINLIAIGSKMPEWVKTGFSEYQRRLTQDCKLNLHEIPAIKRTKQTDLNKVREIEGQKILTSIPSGNFVIALEVNGKNWSTEALSQQMSQWMLSGQDISLLIGGPEGLSQSCRDKADQLWSLSPLTLPHPLVRIIVAEQLYRAWSILKNHPYHR